MFWIIVAAAVFAVSLVFAVYQILTCKNPFRDQPCSDDQQIGLFLLKESSQITSDVLIALASQPSTHLAIEMLKRGSSSAVVYFGNRSVLTQQKLDFLEIEDYVESLDPTLVKSVTIKNLPETELSLTAGLIPDFLNQIKLSKNEQVDWQVVVKSGNSYQVSSRVLVSSPSISGQAKIVSSLEEYLGKNSTLVNAHTTTDSNIYLNTYINRQLDSENILNLTKEQLLGLLSK